MQQRAFLAVMVLLGLVLLASSSVYIVDQREKAILFQFGEIIRSEHKPGPYLKIPFLQSVQFYDGRIQTMDASPEPYLTNEKKQLVVDSFVKWRINDPRKYYTSVSGLTSSAQSRLAQIVNNGLREEFGRRDVSEVISGERGQIMDSIRERMNKEGQEYGIEVVDVRLKRVDFEKEISQSVYQRMRAERAEVAKERRAQGHEEAERIRSDADRQSKVLLAEAYRDAELLRGEGDASATEVYAKAFSKDRDFYSLYRSLNAYRETFKDRKDVLILEPDSQFFRYFKKIQ